MVQTVSTANTAEARPSWKFRLHRLRRYLAPPRNIRPTRAGYGFMLMSLSIGFAALNTSNNLLYLVLGMMLSLIAASGVLSELSVMRITIMRQLPAEVVSGRDAVVTLVAKNRKTGLPGVGIWLQECRVDRLETSRCFAVYIPAGGETSLASTYRFSRRGTHKLESVEICTTYPFGLFRRSYHYYVEDSVLVFPPVEALKRSRDTRHTSAGETPVTRQGQGEEFFGLRTYNLGDDPRLVHWKSSAKRGRLLIREYAAQQRWRVLVRLEIANPLPEEDAYERALVQLVSYCNYFLDQDVEVAMEIPGQGLPFGQGYLQLRRILRLVALAPRAAVSAELPPTGIKWPAVHSVTIRVAGLEVMVEESQ